MEFAESLIDKKTACIRSVVAKYKAHEEKILLPQGSIIDVGVVDPVKLKVGTLSEGGADQIMFPQNWSEKWIIGYRRATQLQLMEPPCFPLEKDNLPLIDKEETLYKNDACCFCGGSNVTRLKENE